MFLEDIKEDLLIYGLKLVGITRPFKVGAFTIYPSYNLRKYLRGYDLDKIEAIIDSEATFAKFKKSTETDSTHAVDNLIGAFRLLKPGWIIAKTIMPVVKTPNFTAYQELENPPTEQMWSQLLYLELSRAELTRLRRIYKDIRDLNESHLEVALRRFNRSYDYWVYSNLDDCLVDLAIALESITSRGGDSIRQSMAMRVSLLLGRKAEDRRLLEKKVNKFYDERCKIVHGEKTPEETFKERFEALDDYRALTRDVINTSIHILKSRRKMAGKPPKTMAEVIDEYIYNKLHRY